jgi:dihydroxyacetone kinase DhaKLM complex PTS-EIIA-like component DhaM
MKKLNMLCLAIMAITIGCLGFNNYMLEKRIEKLEGDMYLTNMQLNNTSMKLEMFLEMIEEEMHSSIKRIARPIAREEVIKGFQEFSENLNNLD